MRAYYGDDEPRPVDPPNEAGCFLAVLTENAEPRVSASALGFVPNLPHERVVWHDEDAVL
jgi:hypothetical protein